MDYLEKIIVATKEYGINIRLLQDGRIQIESTVPLKSCLTNCYSAFHRRYIKEMVDRVWHVPLVEDGRTSFDGYYVVIDADGFSELLIKECILSIIVYMNNFTVLYE